LKMVDNSRNYKYAEEIKLPIKYVANNCVLHLDIKITGNLF